MFTPSDATNPPRTGPAFRAERLGYALRSLAADLVDERHKVAELRREVAELRARLESLKEPHPGSGASSNTADPEPGLHPARPVR